MIHVYIYMDTMQSAADSMQASFPCNYTGYDGNKGHAGIGICLLLLYFLYNSHDIVGYVFS